MKNPKLSYIKLLSAAVLSTSLAACGGGGSNDATADTDAGTAGGTETSGTGDTATGNTGTGNTGTGTTVVPNAGTGTTDSATGNSGTTDTSTGGTGSTDTATGGTGTTDTSTGDTGATDASTGGTGTTDTTTTGGTGTTDTATGDTGTTDTSTSDSGSTDTATGDTGTTDTSTGDTGTTDTATGDTGTTDNTTGDTGTTDTATGDTGTTDTSTGDSGTTDTATGDTGTTDTSTGDTGTADTTTGDTGTTDTSTGDTGTTDPATGGTGTTDTTTDPEDPTIGTLTTAEKQNIARFTTEITDIFDLVDTVLADTSSISTTQKFNDCVTGSEDLAVVDTPPVGSFNTGDSITRAFNQCVDAAGDEFNGSISYTGTASGTGVLITAAYDFNIKEASTSTASLKGTMTVIPSTDPEYNSSDAGSLTIAINQLSAQSNQSVVTYEKGDYTFTLDGNKYTYTVDHEVTSNDIQGTVKAKTDANGLTGTHAFVRIGTGADAFDQFTVFNPNSGTLTITYPGNNGDSIATAKPDAKTYDLNTDGTLSTETWEWTELVDGVVSSEGTTGAGTDDPTNTEGTTETGTEVSTDTGSTTDTTNTGDVSEPNDEQDLTDLLFLL